ncbi:Methyltransferase type 11 [Crinalium epipsammum PCC 9333]|uniref:Methyltransferase type 11 n=1 Tax=Crinalium epipsammum PCC 9333 TaxID=1173022 RepID=K9W1V2_9CYAN|nr:class I SAM-dependent methyltransferase [Crinalium epipsammum]AFZ13779.1 Methyltransferase type 11 [Crinalium epipsammum PCC 9333]
MATILRDWSYRYQWLYDAIAQLSSVAVGGETRFRQLALEGLTIDSSTKILDLCCGSGQATKFLVQYSDNVTGLDASPLSLKRAQNNVPQAKYVEAFAEEMPFPDNQFDLVHTSVAMHEMQPEQLQQILKEVYRVLKPGGVLAVVDFHAPTNWLFWPGLALFFLLFETETAWKLIKIDFVGLLEKFGFNVNNASLTRDKSSAVSLYAGGSIQVIHAQK